MKAQTEVVMRLLGPLSVMENRPDHLKEQTDVGGKNNILYLVLILYDHKNVALFI